MSNSGTDVNQRKFKNNFELGFSPLDNFASLSNVNRTIPSFDLKVTSNDNNLVSRKEILPLATPKINLGWDRFTSKRMRLEKETHIKEKMYRLNPVIRWDARHTGTIELKALVHRKYIGGKDGVKIVILHVTDPTISTGTKIIGTTYLLPKDTNWVEISGSGKVNIKFEEALLFIVDTIDDVPVDEKGNLVDEVELEVEIKYVSVILPGQPSRDLTNEDLKHIDATGQLAYYYHFPTDLSSSELPRDTYWQIIPPIGSTRVNEDNTVDYNRIIGTISKVEKTQTPVHVRIRCESLRSQEADDDSIYSLGSILYERIFTPEEIGETYLDVDLPSPWIAQSNPIKSEDIIAILSNRIRLNSLEELNKNEITIGVPTESIERIVREILPKVKTKIFFSNDRVVYTEHYIASLLKYGSLDAYIERYENAAKIFSRTQPTSIIFSHLLTIPEVSYIWPSISNPISIMQKRSTFLFKPLRLLFEVDGENGFEIPPTAINWKPVMEIVSIYDMEEVREPSYETPVVLVSKDSEIGKKVLTFEDLNQAGPLISVDGLYVDITSKHFPNASLIPPGLGGPAGPFSLEEFSTVGFQLIGLLRGNYDAIVAEYGTLLEAIHKVENYSNFPLGYLPDFLKVSDHAFFLGINNLPKSLFGSIRALVRDEQILGNNNDYLQLYDYNDLNKSEITIAFVSGSDAEKAVKHWTNVNKHDFLNNEEALKDVMDGKANALIADKEFIEVAKRKSI